MQNVFICVCMCVCVIHVHHSASLFNWIGKSHIYEKSITFLDKHVQGRAQRVTVIFKSISLLSFLSI